MPKKTEQIFQGHVTHIMSILMSFFSFSFKTTVFISLFSILNLDFTIYFCILVLYSVFGKHKLGSSIIDQIEKTAFTTEFFTVANTLVH